MTFLELLLESIILGNKKPPKPKAGMSVKISKASWRRLNTNRKYKRIIPKKSSLLSGRALRNQTDKTRSVWDPKGYKAQQFYDKVYRTV